MRIHKDLEGLTVEEKKEKLLELIGPSYPICIDLHADDIYSMEYGMASIEWDTKKSQAGLQQSFSSEGGLSKPYDQMFGNKRGKEIGEWLHLRYRWDRTELTCKGMMFHPNMILPVKQLTEPEVEVIYHWARQLKGFMEAFDKHLRWRK